MRHLKEIEYAKRMLKKCVLMINKKSDLLVFESLVAPATNDNGLISN